MKTELVSCTKGCGYVWGDIPNNAKYGTKTEKVKCPICKGLAYLTAPNTESAEAGRTINMKKEKQKKATQEESDYRLRQPIIEGRTFKSADGQWIVSKITFTTIKPVAYYEALLEQEPLYKENEED